MKRRSHGDISGIFPTDKDGWLRDVDGRWLDLPAMCSESLVLVCTFKCVLCPVCPEQMRRILREPLGGFFREAGVRFMVLCPGPAEHLRASRDHLKPFLAGQNVPFICDEDLGISSGINAILGPGQIIPCFFELRPDLSIGWTQVGRGPGNFGEGKVQRFVTEALAAARTEAERGFQGLSEHLPLVPALLSKEVQQALVAQSSVHPSMLESCLQLLDPEDRIKASMACREWRLGQASLAQAEAERCVAELCKLREAHVLETKNAERRDGMEPWDCHAWAGVAVPVLCAAADKLEVLRRLLPAPPPPTLLRDNAETFPAAAMGAADAVAGVGAAPGVAAPTAAPGGCTAPPQLTAPLAAAAAGVALLAGLARWCRGGA